MNQFSRANFSRNALLRPQYTLSAAILFQPKVTVTAATNQSACGRITVAAARRKGPMGHFVTPIMEVNGKFRPYRSFCYLNSGS